MRHGEQSVRAPRAVLVVLSLLLAIVTPDASAEQLKGKVSRGKYTSPRGLFVVRVPEASNWARVPFTIEEASETGDRNYDSVFFYVKDFGEVLQASVRRIPLSATDEMSKDDPVNVVKTLADKALSDWRQDMTEVPSPLVDELVPTPYGQAALRIYRVPNGSQMRGNIGPGQEPIFPDAVVAVVAVRRNDQMISAIAESDFSFLQVQTQFHRMPNELREHMEEEDRKELKARLLEFFGGMTVPQVPKFEGP